jgi:hypothetical protein
MSGTRALSCVVDAPSSGAARWKTAAEEGCSALPGTAQKMRGRSRSLDKLWGASQCPGIHDLALVGLARASNCSRQAPPQRTPQSVAACLMFWRGRETKQRLSTKVNSSEAGSNHEPIPKPPNPFRSCPSACQLSYTILLPTAPRLFLPFPHHTPQSMAEPAPANVSRNVVYCGGKETLFLDALAMSD